MKRNPYEQEGCAPRVDDFEVMKRDKLACVDVRQDFIVSKHYFGFGFGLGIGGSGLLGGGPGRGG